MKKLSWIIFLFLVFHTSVAQLNGRVVGISDGDTFTLLTPGKQKMKIRLFGIDCPEKDQGFGQVAKKYLSNLIYDRQVKVKQMNTDYYGRVIAVVHIDGVNVNEKMLESGLAWHYTLYDDNEAWSELEALAKKEKKGLWQRNDAIAPWQYRKMKKRKALQD